MGRGREGSALRGLPGPAPPGAAGLAGFAFRPSPGRCGCRGGLGVAGRLEERDLVWNGARRGGSGGPGADTWRGERAGPGPVELNGWSGSFLWMRLMLPVALPLAGINVPLNITLNIALAARLLHSGITVPGVVVLRASWDGTVLFILRALTNSFVD